MPNTTYVADAAVNANTEVSLADQMDEPFDVRADNDPIDSAVEADAGTAAATNYTSVGQGATDDPAAGEVVVTGPYSVAFGDALEAGDVVAVAYEGATGTEQV